MLIKASNLRNKKLKISYYLAGLNLFIEGLVFIPPLLGFHYSEDPIPLLVLLAYVGALWSISVYSIPIPSTVVKISIIFLSIWFVIASVLQIIQHSFWLPFFVIGMNIIGIFLIILILYAFHEKQRIYSEYSQSIIFQSPRSFTLVGLGIFISILAPLFGFITINEESTFLLHPIGVLIGISLIGYALVDEFNYSQVQAQKALKESESKSGAILSAIPDLMFLISREGVFLDWSGPQESLFMPPEEFLGKNIKDIMPKEIANQTLHFINKALRTKEVQIYEYELPIGEKRCYFESRLVISGKSNAISVVRDITERKNVEQKILQSQKTLQLILDSMPFAILIVDRDKKIQQVNKATLMLLGYEHDDEIIGKTCHGNLCPAEVDLCPILDLKMELDRSERSAITKSGENIPILKSVVPITLEGKEVLLEALIDVKERKQAEDAFKQVKLEEERYHAMLSHFINNDLQVIASNVELLAMMKGESDEEVDIEVVNGIFDIISRSSKTIDTVSEIFRILQSPLSDQYETTYNLLEVVDSVVSELRTKSTLHYPIHLEREKLDLVMFVDENLSVAFHEILEFILRSKPKTAKISSPIIIGGSQKHSQFCVRIHENHTSPIPEEVCTRICGKITENWEHRGHYIGISLASVILQHYGGSLKIQPFEDYGNEYHLLFPLKLIHKTI